MCWFHSCRQNKADIGYLKAAENITEGKMEKNIADIGSLQEKATFTEGKTEMNMADISNLKATANVTNDKMEKNMADIGYLKATENVTNGKMETNMADIANLQEKATFTDSRIQQLQDEAKEAGEKSEKDEADIANLQEKATFADGKIHQLQDEAKKAGEKREKDERAWQTKLALLSQVEKADIDRVNKQLDAKVQEMHQFTEDRSTLLQRIEEAKTERVKVQLELEMKQIEEAIKREAAAWRATMEREEWISYAKIDLIAKELQGEIDSAMQQYELSKRIVEYEIEQVEFTIAQLESNQRILFLAGIPIIALNLFMMFLFVWLFFKKKDSNHHEKISSTSIPQEQYRQQSYDSFAACTPTYIDPIDSHETKRLLEGSKK